MKSPIGAPPRNMPMSDTTQPHTEPDPLALPAEAIDLGEALFARPWEFVRTVPSLDWLPDADRPEIAFAGRSNVGKSSLINALTRRGGLARTSNTPGRTQDLNFFQVPEVPLWLVDMPGYGFADAPKAKVEAWTKFVKDYLRGRTTLRRVFVLIDSRHGIKAPDREIFTLLNECAVSFVGVLTKLDKLNTYEQAKIIATVTEGLSKEPAAFPRVCATSSEKAIGLAELRAEIIVAAELKTLPFLK
jgi:GTP-binding protein